jgi:hypothetical protein
MSTISYTTEKSFSSEACLKFTRDLTLRNVAEYVVLDWRVGQVRNLRHECVLAAG